MLEIDATWHDAGVQTCDHLVQALQPRVARTMLQFAEQEFIIPTGEKYKGRPFRLYRQPVFKLWFDEMESGRWYEFAGTGPSQSGKSLHWFVLPILYHLFERGETVIVGLPTQPMARDKWERDIEPAITASRYRSMIPKVGTRGDLYAVPFKNGAHLRFMTAGGNDKSRSHFTAGVLVFTETDGMDVAQTTSQESNPIKQIEARARSLEMALRRIYKECTVTTDKGYIWRQVHEVGSGGRIVLPCSHCGHWVTPEREDLVGWQNAEHEHQAKRDTRFCCPDCRADWSEQDRRQANRQAKLVHKGQEIDEHGVIHGDYPPTRVLGMRYSGVNNMFLPASDLGVDEWEAIREEDAEDAEKEMCQFVWCLPYVPAGFETIELDRKEVAKKQIASTHKGLIPSDAQYVSLGVDVGKYVLHWTAIAARSNGASEIFDYGELPLQIGDKTAKHLGFDSIFKQCMSIWWEQVATGWPIADRDGELRTFDQLWIDSRWQGDDKNRYTVIDWIKSLGRDWLKRVRPTMGLGSKQADRSNRRYRHPDKQDDDTRLIGWRYFFKYSHKHRIYRVFVDADHWKTVVHAALAQDVDTPGSLSLYSSMDEGQHTKFIAHLTSERQETTFEKTKGHDTQWVTSREANHWLDSTQLAMCAAHYAGHRSHPALAKPVQTERRRATVRRPRIIGRRLSYRR